MPIPVINPIQSVIGYPQYRAFEVQFSATNTPTSWSCSPLPVGLTFDTAIGRIAGAASFPGVTTFYVTATNASGTSDAKLFTMGIEASGAISPANIVDLTIEVSTRKVTRSGGGSDGALFFTKYGDGLLMHLTFTKAGVPFLPDLTALKFAMKQFEPEGILVTTSTFAAKDTGYLVYALIEGNALRAALSDNEEDEGTQFFPLCEFEWVENNPVTPNVGPSTIRSSSQTFRAQLPRDIIANS